MYKVRIYMCMYIMNLDIGSDAGSGAIESRACYGGKILGESYSLQISSFDGSTGLVNMQASGSFNGKCEDAQFASHGNAPRRNCFLFALIDIIAIPYVHTCIIYIYISFFLPRNSRWRTITAAVWAARMRSLLKFNAPR